MADESVSSIVGNALSLGKEATASAQVFLETLQAIAGGLESPKALPIPPEFMPGAVPAAGGIIPDGEIPDYVAKGLPTFAGELDTTVEAGETPVLTAVSPVLQELSLPDTSIGGEPEPPAFTDISVEELTGLQDILNIDPPVYPMLDAAASAFDMDDKEYPDYSDHYDNIMEVLPDGEEYGKYIKGDEWEQMLLRDAFGKAVDAQVIEDLPVVVCQRLKDIMLAKDSSSGLIFGHSVEQKIFERQSAREILATEASKDAAMNELARRGFTIPDGVASAQLQKLEVEFGLKRADTARDIAIEQQKLLVSSVIEAMKVSPQLVTGILDLVFKVVKDRIEVLKLVDGYMIERAKYEQAFFDAKVKDWEAAFNKATKEFETGWKVNFEQPKAMYDAGKAAADAVYDADVKNADATMKNNEFKIKAYESKITAAKFKLEINKLRSETYDTAIKAFNARIQLIAAKIALYDAQVKGEIAKIQIYEAQIKAYQFEVQAYATQLEAKTSMLKARISAFEALVTQYNAEIEGYKAESQGQIANIDGHTKALVARIDAYRAQVGAEEANAGIVLKQNEMALQSIMASAQLSLESAKASAQIKLEEYKLRYQAAEGGADVFARYAAMLVNAVSGVMQQAEIKTEVVQAPSAGTTAV